MSGRATYWGILKQDGTMTDRATYWLTMAGEQIVLIPLMLYGCLKTMKDIDKEREEKR